MKTLEKGDAVVLEWQKNDTKKREKFVRQIEDIKECDGNVIYKISRYDEIARLVDNSGGENELYLVIEQEDGTKKKYKRIITNK